SASRFMLQVKSAVSRILPIAIGLGAAFLVLKQVQSDLIQHGVRGLLGPVEGLAAFYGLIRLVTALTRGKPAWAVWRRAVHYTMYGVLAVCAFVACVALG